jgi:hypothetical protein
VKRIVACVCVGALVLAFLLAANYASTGQSTPAQDIAASDAFSFAVAADMREYAGPGRYDTPQYFRGAAQAIAALHPDFLVVPGDLDPVPGVHWTITQTLGAAYPWYPLVGNHELPGEGDETNYGDNMRVLRTFDYGVVNPGPAGCPTTTYSFDYANAHFVMLNEYCDAAGDTATNGDIPDPLYDWLAADLSAADSEHIFVFGHEPAYPQPDADNGRLRHQYDSLNEHPANRDRFWALLRDRRVTAYICGHTHNYSAVQIDGVWQIDAGHARGLGDDEARSTFVIVYVDDGLVRFHAWRDDSQGGAYALRRVGYLSPAYRVRFPLLVSIPGPPER